jgi:hypothetical protein
MTRLKWLIMGLVLATTISAYAAYTNLTPVTIQELIAGEDQTGNVIRVEIQNTYATPVATDTLIKTGAGYARYLSCSPTDNAATAGTVQLRDATSAGTGTIMVEWTVLAIDYTVNVPKVFPVDSLFATGLYLDFTTTSDVKCWVSYR